jgi:uncharacterized membrane protein YqhA
MTNKTPHSHETLDRFSQIIGRSRFVVLLAVVAVMLVSISLFVLGTIQAVVGIWGAWAEVLRGEIHATHITVEFLEIVTTMLKAVVFHLIGVGLYSLFVSPLNITISMGIETLHDLESRVINVVVVILAVTFLEHFILWRDPGETLYFGAAAAVMIIALVIFERYSHKVKEASKTPKPVDQIRAQRTMFNEEEEKAEIDQEPPESNQETSDSKQ